MCPPCNKPSLFPHKLHTCSSFLPTKNSCEEESIPMEEKNKSHLHFSLVSLTPVLSSDSDGLDVFSFWCYLALVIIF